MLSRFKYFTLFYLFIIVANIVVLYYIKDYRMVAKPMIIGSLLGFYIGNVIKQSPIFIMGMVFALIGDVFLLFEDVSFFVVGLGSFLLMQVFYTVEFYKDIAANFKSRWLAASLIYLVGFVFLILMWDNLGGLKWPVLIYTIAITTMGVMAWMRKREIIWYKEVIAGVLLFLLSDTWLGLSKFGVISNNYSGLIVIVTYMLAQYLIVRGIVEREVSNS